MEEIREALEERYLEELRETGIYPWEKLQTMRSKTDRELHSQIMKETFPDLTSEHIAKCMNRIYGEVA
ncbi:hypothetical protein OAU34_00980 [Gammaproteobacteria bacterium]|nr:hypothetical protein [Gammaproteobacteria bacterium]|tara:strand:+ start:1069 stop:1272 length:204 start_codon:yes stop_codon:yes gene_type:complete